MKNPILQAVAALAAAATLTLTSCDSVTPPAPYDDRWFSQEPVHDAAGNFTGRYRPEPTDLGVERMVVGEGDGEEPDGCARGATGPNDGTCPAGGAPSARAPRPTWRSYRPLTPSAARRE